ncbi:acyl-CoA carboxylase subunit epsilon [Nocardioides sp. CFH 31398]|uniref:acyl-CoA carboxylase subunit epsilon n=1 Tax=Nocardioides sp. CFH 31398 TaxID=2919579 RepID=UPI001F062E55|nr:acyl-CoA carboxylase subunit epsilon [Nocardioides sp. CFH 31398]MCH1866412.1 acyl-CoA carboxylase subunit epsilon [Nocardioides sp. CFH 31398]
MSADDQAPSPPFLRVVKGDPTPEELAALVAVVAAASGGGEAPAPRRPSEWSRPARRLRTPHQAGPGAWRASGLPR